VAEAAGRLRAAVGAVTARRLTGSWWRQGAVGYPLASLPETARSAGRSHRRGQRPVLYASDSERAAWAELLRHHQSPELDPFHIRRRVGRLELHDLAVLDVTDPAVLD
jgi:hypothetical protein